MTPTITCLRCKQSGPGMIAAPLPPPYGDELVSGTCPGCFKDWMNTEIMIINEYKLDLGVPRNQDLLNQEMARFLSLPSGHGEAPQGAPPQATPTAAHGHGSHDGHDHGEDGHDDASHDGHAHGKDGHDHGKGGGSCC